MPSEESRRIRASFTRSEGVNESPLDVQRQEWEAAAAQTPLPAGTIVEPVTLGTVVCEQVRFAQTDTSRILVWLHGGGFNAGSSITHRDLAARLALASDASVVLVNYRLAPEHPFPAAVDDTLSVYRALRGSGNAPTHIAIGGDSAGGGVAMSALLGLRDAGDALPIATVLLSPWVDLALAGPSMTDRAAVDPMVAAAALRRAVHYHIGERDPRDPMASPVYADLHDLPPMLIHVGDHEVLLSDAERLARHALAAGVDIQLKVWPEMWHVFPTFAPALPEAKQALDEIGAYLRTLFAER